MAERKRDPWLEADSAIRRYRIRQARMWRRVLIDFVAVSILACTIATVVAGLIVTRPHPLMFESAGRR